MVHSSRRTVYLAGNFRIAALNHKNGRRLLGVHSIKGQRFAELLEFRFELLFLSAQCSESIAIAVGQAAALGSTVRPP
ncbi:hypothetical protein GC176_25790 [bacterium]|nr:hypothetical protein [bacterium]